METPILDDILARVRDALEHDDIGAATTVPATMHDKGHIALPPELSPTNPSKQEASDDDQKAAAVC